VLIGDLSHAFGMTGFRALQIAEFSALSETWLELLEITASVKRKIEGYTAIELIAGKQLY
jgi:hypothetical protein